MILQLRELLRHHRQLPLKELARGLGTDEATCRLMLERLTHRGEVKKLPAGTLCGGGCSRCPPEQVEIYRWTGIG